MLVVQVLGSLILLYAIVGLVIHGLTIVEKWIDRRTIHTINRSSRATRAKSRLLGVTLVATLAVTPIIGFLTNVASDLSGENAAGAFTILFVLVFTIATLGVFLIRKLNQADEDDYWDYSSLIRDLQDEKDAENRPSERQLEMYRQALGRLDKQMDESHVWVHGHPRGAVWQHAVRAAQLAEDTPKARLNSLASSIPRKDAVVYLLRRRGKSLSYALAAAVGGLALVLSSGTNWSDFLQIVARTVFGLALTIPWIVLALLVARLELINSLAWLVVRENEKQLCTQLLRELEALEEPVVELVQTSYYPLGSRLTDAWAVLRSSRK